MSSHFLTAIDEPSRIGEARRGAATLALACGFDEVSAGRLALAVNELGNNLAHHAQGGKLLIGRATAATVEDAIEVFSVDAGPGMRDVESCLVDGYSTGGTPGSGLGAVRRLALDFEIVSRPGVGTAMRVLIAPRSDAIAAAPPSSPESGDMRPPFLHAGICVPAPGETECGDGWAWNEGPSGPTLLVADGLGHGPEAARASGDAIQILRAHGDMPLSDLLAQMHARLRHTRGAALAVARLLEDGRRLQYCGAGNISGRILSPSSDRSLLSQHGTVGLAMRTPQPMAYDWPEHALLVMHSDGIASRWSLDQIPELFSHSPSLVAAWLLCRHARGRDDAAVVVVKADA